MSKTDFDNFYLASGDSHRQDTDASPSASPDGFRSLTKFGFSEDLARATSEVDDSNPDTSKTDARRTNARRTEEKKAEVFPSRRQTDLNGEPETVPFPNRFLSEHAEQHVEQLDAACENAILDDNSPDPRVADIRAASESPSAQTGSATGRIEYFLEHVVLRSFIQPPSLPDSQWREDQREEAYTNYTLELYRLRLRLVTGIAMAMLLLHTLFYVCTSPNNARIYVTVYAALIVLSLLARCIMKRLLHEDAARRLCLRAYVVFCLGAALIVGVVGESQSFFLGGHNHIILTTLLLPFAASECLLVGAMAIASLAVSGWITFMPQNPQLYFSQLFTLCTTSAFVVFVSFFQNAMRRRAFDAAFDAMCSVARYQHLSMRDALTGGHNRRHLLQTLDTEIARAVRFSRPISLILFDLDNFKKVNDTLGHGEGDRVLVDVWNIATKAVRNVDTPARYGGDEFAVVLPEADEDDAYAVATRLHSATSSHLVRCYGAHSPQGKVTLSVGTVTLRPQDIISAEQFLFMADTQLYNAKKAGKNRIM